MKWYDALKATGPFGWISWLVSAFNKNDSTFQKLGSGVESVFNKYTGSALTGAEQESNRFSAEEAQKQRDWETEMSNTAFQRQAADMQAAGLNPALMYGGTGSSGASTPSGSSASSVSPSSGSLSDIISNIMDMALLKANIENINADTENKRAEATGRGIENQFKPDILEQNLRRGEVDIDNILQGIRESESRISVNASTVALNDATVKQVLALADKTVEEVATERLRQKNLEVTNDLLAEEILNYQADRVLKVLEQSVLKSQASLNFANAKNVSLESVEREFNNQFRDEFGVNPSGSMLNTAVGLLGKASNGIVNFGMDILKLLKR